MQSDSIAKWQHEHVFGQDQVKSGERQTLVVVVITGAMMVVEIVAGIAFGSMALLADGIHMGSHMVGLMITLIAYVLARKYATDDRFSFGTGKVNSLAGYTSALLLMIFALFMGYESILRFFNPVEIQYNVAILVAVIGLIVNGASMLILGEKGHDHGHAGEHSHDHDADTHDHSHDHDHHHDHHNHDDHGHDHGDHDLSDHRQVTRHDHNLKAAYLHVLADAMTSVFAIFALLAAKYFGWIWADPFMGVVGAVLVSRWSVGLIRNTSSILLDHQVPMELRKRIIDIVESYKDTRVSDLHIWSIGPGIYSANVSVVTSCPATPDDYKKLIPCDTGVVHATVEVHPCPN